MDKQKKVISEIPFGTQPGGIIRVSVYYDKGGHSYFSGGDKPRGYYLVARPMSVSPTDTPGIYIEEYAMFSGYKELILPAARFSEKVLRELAPPQELIDRMVEGIKKKSATVANPPKPRIILRPKGPYDRGTYRTESSDGGHWHGLTIWDSEKNGAVADMKHEGYAVYEIGWRTPAGSSREEEYLKKL